MKGLSLIEAVCALGLVAAGLLSAAGLLVSGARQIAGAGRASTALAVDRLVLEELAHLGFERATALLECDTAEVACEAGPGHAAAEVWAGLGAARLGPTEVDVRLEAVDAPSLVEATTVRIAATVSWVEGPRRRSVRLVTARG